MALTIEWDDDDPRTDAERQEDNKRHHAEYRSKFTDEQWAIEEAILDKEIEDFLAGK